MGSTSIQLRNYGIKTHQGPYLTMNEDHYLLDHTHQLFLLFDGAGGPNSLLATEKFQIDVKTMFAHFDGVGDATMPFFFNPKFLLETNALINSLQLAHKNLFKANQKISIQGRSLISFVGGFFSSSHMSLVSVGNVASYLFRKGHMNKLFYEDYLGHFSSDQFHQTQTTFPLGAAGLFEEMYVEVRELKLCRGDKVVCLTDGAYGRLSEQELKYIIDKPNQTHQEKVDEIFQMNNDRGNKDNQSVLILEF
jgi:serine/threonine protein phosphatase PrpC